MPYHLYSIPPVSCSYQPCMFPSWYHLLSLYLLLYVCAPNMIFNTCSFDSNLSIYVCLSLPPFGILHTTGWGVSDSPGSLCPDPRAWSLWILSVADQRWVAKAWIIGRSSEALFIPASCSALKFSFCDSWASFCTVHYCISLVFSHLRLSVM